MSQECWNTNLLSNKKTEEGQELEVIPTKEKGIIATIPTGVPQTEETIEAPQAEGITEALLAGVTTEALLGTEDTDHLTLTGEGTPMTEGQTHIGDLTGGGQVLKIDQKEDLTVEIEEEILALDMSQEIDTGQEMTDLHLETDTIEITPKRTLTGNKEKKFKRLAHLLTTAITSSAKTQVVCLCTQKIFIADTMH